jgi:hypothetical protein
MAITKIRGATQIRDGTIQKHNIDITTSGESMITSIVAGSGIMISGTGYDTGTGVVTIISTATGSTSIPVVTVDPGSPTDGQLWLLRETTGAIPDGTAIGMMAFTYVGNSGSVTPLQLSVNDNGTTRRVQFA